MAEQHVEEHREHRDRGRVVEQTLAFEQPAEPRWRADVAEDADDGDRIRGRHDRAEKQAREQRRRRDPRESDADDERLDEHGDDGQQQDGRGVLNDALHADRERGLEEQQGQEDVDEDRRAHRQVVERLGDAVERARRIGLKRGRRSKANRHADHREQN